MPEEEGDRQGSGGAVGDTDAQEAEDRSSDDRTADFRRLGLSPKLATEPDAVAAVGRIRALEGELAELDARREGLAQQLTGETHALEQLDDRNGPGRNFDTVRQGLGGSGYGDPYARAEAMQPGDYLRVQRSTYNTWVAQGESRDAKESLPTSGIAKVTVVEIRKSEGIDTQWGSTVVLEADGSRREVDSSLFIEYGIPPDLRQ